MFARRVPFALVVTLFACAPQNPPPTPSTPVHPRAAEALPPSPDVSQQVMGWLVISDGDRLASQLSPDSHVDAQARAAALLSQLGLQPDVAALIDLSRPAALALLNPSLLGVGHVQPYVAMVPIRSRADVERLLTSRAAVTRTPWGLSVPTAKDARMDVAFVRGYAVVAWRPDLLNATVKLLGPRLAAKADAPLLVHVDFDNVRQVYRPQLEAMLGQMVQSADRGGGDPEVTYALRDVKRLARHLESVSTLELLANLDSGGLTLTLRADARAGSELHGYVRQQQPGPAWGVQFLPRDAVLAYATHASAAGRAADLADSVAYLADADAAHPASAPERDEMRRAFERAAVDTDGQLAYAVWPGRDGGVGLGGAYHVINPVAARAAVGDLYRTLAPHLGSVAMRALGFDADKLARRVKVTHGTVQLGGVDADTVTLSVDWPKNASSERQLFEAMFGKRLVLATAFVGDQALFTVGADWQPRLAAMIGTARGMPAASLGDEPAFVEALRYKPDARVSLTYLPTDRMAQFSAGLAAQSGRLDADQEQAVARLLSRMGSGAIVSTTNAGGRRYELTTHVPGSAIAGVAQLNGAMWRMALSPLVNPPMMPPMPVPPPHVAPSVKPATTGTAGTL